MAEGPLTLQADPEDLITALVVLRWVEAHGTRDHPILANKDLTGARVRLTEAFQEAATPVLV